MLTLKGQNNLLPYNTGVGERKYLAVRWEGMNSTSGTPGYSNSIYEIYFFADGWCELRIGNWSGSGQVSPGVYTSQGYGWSFANAISADTCYVFFLSSYTTFSYLASSVNYYYYNHAYENGLIVPKTTSSARAPLLGSSAIASANWPPTGWTSMQSQSADDQALSLSVVSNWQSNYSVLYSWYTYHQLSDIYIVSNGYITFGGSSTAYSSLSYTNPALDKIMIGATDRSHQQVAWKIGYK